MHMPVLDRRTLLLGLGAVAIAPAAARTPILSAELARLEQSIGGRFGAVVLDANGVALLAHRAEERFLFCSVFKTFLAGAVLRRVDQGRLDLARALPVTPADMVSYSPAVEAALPAGAMTIEALCRAATIVSDNASANLLLPLVGGPAGLTRFMRRLGGRSSRLDRIEPALNTPHGAKDSTTPQDAAAMLRALLAPSQLSARSRERLEAWMIESRTGRNRLRAGLPADWRAGDKTGTGPKGPANDIAFIDVPKRGRVFVSAFLEAPERTGKERDEVIAAFGRLVAATVA